MAYYVDRKREKLESMQNGLIPALFVLFLIMSLIIIQPDYSTAIMIGFLGIIILFVLEEQNFLNYLLHAHVLY